MRIPDRRCGLRAGRPLTFASIWCVAATLGLPLLHAQEAPGPPTPPARPVAIVGPVVAPAQLGLFAVVGPVAGSVRDRTGAPVAGAVLVTTVPGFRLPFENGALNATPDGKLSFATSQADGTYLLPPPLEPTLDQPPAGAFFGVFAVHERGYARKSAAELVRSGDLTLEPWGRVEGTVEALGRPLAGVPVRVMLNLTDEHSMGLEYSHYAARTDELGRFAVDRVPAGLVGAATGDRSGKDPGPYGVIAASPKLIIAGETLRLAIGGTGRPVVGKLRQADGTPFPLGGGFLLLDPGPAPVRLTDEAMKTMTPVQRFRASLDQDRSPAEKARRLGLRFSQIQAQPDGAFRAIAVEPGTYTLFVRVDEDLRHPIRTREVVVPPIPGDRSDEPLDLGTIDVPPPTPK